MRSKAWLAVRVSLQLARLPRVCQLWLARLPRTTSSAQLSHRLRSTRAAVPVFLAHAEVTKNIIVFPMGPKLRHPAVGERCRGGWRGEPSQTISQASESGTLS